MCFRALNIEDTDQTRSVKGAEYKQQVMERDVEREPGSPEIQNDGIENDFVGRGTYISELRTVFSKYRVFGLFGLRSVGKSKLIREFFKEETLRRNGRNTETDTKHEIPALFESITVDMQFHTTVGSLYSFICSCLKVEPKKNATLSKEWKQHLLQAIELRRAQTLCILFDNAENSIESALRDELLSLFLTLVKECKTVRIYITSTTKVQFARYGKLLYSMEVHPLPDVEAAMLLREASPGVDLGDNEAKLVKLSEGLPLLILMIGSELVSDDQLISPGEMVEMLAKFRLEALSKQYYPAEQRAADVYRKFIERLTEVHQSRLAILGYIPGSFNTMEAKQLLDHDTTAITKHETLVPIRRRYMLKYDPGTERFDIQGILRECLEVFFTIRNLPKVRNRYYATFSEVMKRICQQFGTAEYTKALAEFSLEQPNLFKLLTEVYNSNEENYHFFIEVATSCSDMIERFMPGISDKFYEGCLDVADRYGRDLDKATVHIAIGSLVTNSKGKFPVAEENYRRALHVLETHGKSLQLATVNQRLGWNLHSQGRSFEAIRYLQKSITISETAGKLYHSVFLQALSTLGIVRNWLGSPKEAEKCHTVVLERRQKDLGENNPSLGETYNNFGLLCDQLGDKPKALQYFEKGLALKRQNKGQTTTIPISLNNCANKYREYKRFGEAKTYLNESMNILKGMDNPHHGVIALTYNSYGKLYRDMGDYKTSEQMFGKAVQMRKTIMPKSIPYIWTVIQYAQVKVELGKHAAAFQLMDEIIKEKEVPQKAQPSNDFLVECLKIVAEVFKIKGEFEQLRETQWTLQSELMRLGDVYLSMDNESKMNLITKQLQDLGVNV